MTKNAGLVVSIDSDGRVSSRDYTQHLLHTADVSDIQEPAPEELPATVANPNFTRPSYDDRLISPESVEKGHINWKALDGPVPNGIWRLYGKITMVIMRFGAIALIAPGFAGPSILVAILGGLCGQMYMASQLPVKRMMSNAKAPILGHFGATLTGLTSIRAFGVQARFSEDAQKCIDEYTRPARTFYGLNRWLNVRIGFISSLFSACLAGYLTYFHTLSAGDTGFSLNMAVSFTTELLALVRDLNEFEVQANSLERIQSYLEIEHEPKNTSHGIPPAYWPANGELRVENLSARYTPEGPSVLRNVSFHIKSGERIGIDRKRLFSLSNADMHFEESLVSQPELLSGTLRHNLDPFEQYDDATLNDALRAAGMSALQRGTADEGKLTLDSFISGTGDNLSIGQRQILALARAMVRGGKLLILDEGKWTFRDQDYETDAVIQSSLRRELGTDMTLIIVAHRLQTIMDADKIMVLESGELVEFGSPVELLDNKKGHFRSLVDASGDKEILYAMTRGLN
ncbi:hypothetical protein H0H87_008814 [Tephrocybe sp. NHM501043]|nr:hypothetical protein H0H87_008814 [Tephrocybe sp. NHM501043]